jgi:hypothetical protein
MPFFVSCIDKVQVESLTSRGFIIVMCTLMMTMKTSSLLNFLLQIGLKVESNMKEIDLTKKRTCNRSSH